VDALADLRILLASQHPLILAETTEERRFLDLLRRVTAPRRIAVWVWTAARGLARDGQDPQYGTADPRTALRAIADLPAPAVFVFADGHTVLADPVARRAVKDAVLGLGRDRTLVFTAPRHDPPPELRGLALPWRLRLPGPTELVALVERTVEDLTARGVAARPGPRADLAGALRGLTLAEAERVLQEAVLRDGTLEADDVPWVRRAKAEILNTDGVLELIEAAPGMQAVGLAGLDAWLAPRTRAVEDPEAARAAGLEPPRGILLTGVPGCGKSLAAKALAASWEWPLVLLDPGSVYRKYVGESEQRLASALETAEAMAPIVLWIDEVEKGFATSGDGDGGVGRRLLGSFLRWMQERRDGVFVVATANDVAALPPEFLRKGRFDEVFFVDLPDAAARESILRLHLAGRGIAAERIDVTRLAAETEGYSGAEIEAVVVGGLYRAFAAGEEPATEHLAAEAAATVPLSDSRAADLARLRAWAASRAVPANR
jgi:hypothetical protein